MAHENNSNVITDLRVERTALAPRRGRVHSDGREHETTNNAPTADTETMPTDSVPAASPAVVGTDKADTDHKLLHPGLRVHNYQLIRPLGHGGMGEVYLARDTRLGRRVAIKFMAQQSRSTQFLAEARATARCEHENIVSIYHADEANDHSYMVLEYIEGVTLRDWMRQRWQGHTSNQGPDAEDMTTAEQTAEGPISPTLAVEIMVPVVRALAHAHQLGLVHRDLKPANIMLTDEGAIKVLDFGIAKLLDQELRSPLPDSADLDEETVRKNTREGAIVGTRPYMSPEQWGVDEVDARSDLWAVGLILWELCVGHHPLAPYTRARFKSVAQLDKPMRSLAQEKPELGRVAEIVDTCLVKCKAERVQSAADLLQALEPLLPGRSAATASAPSSSAGSHETPEHSNPYVGLAAFQERDSVRFFGREHEITALMGQLHNHSMVTVTSASGTGKSSFVRAGVLPALARSGQRWEWFIVRPGRQPLEALARVLEQVTPTGSANGGDRGGGPTGASLAAAPGALGTALRARCHERRTRIVLFVDQFEELYTMGAVRGVRERFVRCLEAVGDDASSPLRVVLSMRSDFLDRVAEDRAFMNEITHGLWLLPPMARDQLRRALLQPLSDVGYALEDRDRLTETILDTLESTRVPLPLLQFTAAHLWDLRDRERKCISAASYEALGGVAGALSVQADKVLAGLSAQELRLARIVFTSLVTEERTRAIVSLEELRALTPEGAQLEALVQRLAEARLLLLETDVRTGEATAEICHESLIERWHTLGQWLSEDQEASAFRARLRDAARTWHKQDQSEGLLWRGQAADDAGRWLNHWQRDLPASPASADAVGLGPHDRAYLEAVVGLATRTRKRRKRLVAAAFALVSAIAVVIAILANQALQQAALADEKATLAESESIRARNASRMASAREYQSDPTLVLALVREMEQAAEPGRWRDLARWALHEGVAAIVLPHDDAVSFAAYSPDGDRIVTASRDNVVRVWNADGSGEPVLLQGHQGQVWSAAFSPDGGHIVTASHDKTARIWNADGAGEPIVLGGAGQKGHADVVWSASFSPDGTRVVTASWDRSARVWNADGTGEPLVLSGHEHVVYDAAFSPDGQRIVTASRDKTARIWNANGAGTPLVLTGHQGALWSARFHPSGERIVTASDDKSVRVWNANGKGVPLVLDGHEELVMSAQFSADGDRIVSASYDKTARIWDANDGRLQLTLKGHGDMVRSAMFSPDGAHVVTGSYDRTTRIWDASGKDAPVVLKGHQGLVYSATFSSDGARVATASYDKTARVWNSDGSGTPIVLEGHQALVLTAAFSPDDARIVTASYDKTVRVWSADGADAPLVLSGHQAPVVSAAFSPDGAHIVSASLDQTARVWAADGKAAPMVLAGHEGALSSAAFSPDGTRIVTASHDKTARVWRTDGGGTPVVLEGHQDVVSSAAFSPDGAHIITISRDKTARLWNADGGGTPLIIEGHGAGALTGTRVGDGVFRPDGARIAMVSEDKTIRVWNSDGSGDPIILRAPDLDAQSVVFSPDGARIMSTSHGERIAATGEIQHTVKIWPGVRRFSGLDDTKLWNASNYCPAIDFRVDMLGVSRERAVSEHEACQRKVAEAPRN